MDYIKGKFKKTIFESTNGNGYKVGLFRVKEASDNLKDDVVGHTITFTGYFYDLIIDESYVFEGQYVNNGKYGYQFQVNTYNHLELESKDAIIEFLSSNLVKGCGEKTAKDIVAILGEDCIDIIKEDKTCLMLVPKMTDKKMESIYNSVMKYQNNDEVIIYLTKLGFSMKDATKLLNLYGANIKNIIADNIYSLIDDIEFKTLDKAFFNLNKETDDNRRKACIIETMKTLSFEAGDTYSYIDEIKNALTIFDIYLSTDEIKEYMKDLQSNGQVKIIGDKYFLSSLYEMEEYITTSLYEISNMKLKTMRDIDDKIEKFCKANNYEYNKDQKKAIKTALKENITIITGGPGTGKTTIIKAIAGIFIDNHPDSEDQALSEITLLAPTGRASKRISDLTGLPAMTIHRYLKWDKISGKFEFNEYNRHYPKLLIIDEVSMIDTELFASLLKGIHHNVRLVIVGDDNQLPSVGPGLILTDLISTECFNHIPLKEIYRQSSTSSIPLLCQSIKNHDLTEDSISRKDDFSFLEVENHQIKDTIESICKLSIKKGIDINNMQILAPMYKGENGIDNLNAMLQNIFNPMDKDKREMRVGEVLYREGDKVLQLVNDPDNNIYNGDIGYIKHIDVNNKDAALIVNFYGNGVGYKREDLINIKHAYAITIHKSQGSEFEHIIMPITMNYGRMLYNKLIYTGISRAKKSLTLLGSPRAFYMASNNDYSLNRKTDLVEKILNRFS